MNKIEETQRRQQEEETIYIVDNINEDLAASSSPQKATRFGVVSSTYLNNERRVTTVEEQ